MVEKHGVAASQSDVDDTIGAANAKEPSPLPPGFVDAIHVLTPLIYNLVMQLLFLTYKEYVKNYARCVLLKNMFT